MYGGALVGSVAGASAASAAAASQRVILGGPIVSVDSDYFVRLVSENRDKLLVVHAVVGVFSKTHVYATSYKGFTFVTKTKEPLPITPDVEAKGIWFPMV